MVLCGDLLKHKHVAFFRSDAEVDVERRARELIHGLGGRGVGAIAIFIGVVKDVVEGHRVHELSYEAYEEYALKVLDRIASEELEKSGVEAVEIMHRLGSAKQGEKTLYIAVAARGRKEALEALSRILERVKAEPPIFKLEKRDDGEYYVIGEGRRVKREEI
jgi:molybdopterin synthase catalytic subunit